MEKAKIAIVTDSTCDIPQDLLEEYSIIVVPQIVIWDNEEYLDRVNLQPHEFYQKLINEPTYPSSSAAPIESFVHAYDEAENRGAQEILVLTVSGEMSRTHQNATLAAEQTDLRVKVIDSRAPSMGLGWQVLAAARLLREGGMLNELVAKTAELRQRLALFVGMESIEYLQKGGRIGGAAKWVGTMLHIRPVISINHGSGLVEPVALARTHQKMVDLIVSKFSEKMAKDRLLHISVLHGNCPDEGELLAQRILSELHPCELLLSITGPVLGLNTGPNALALCGYWE